MYIQCICTYNVNKFWTLCIYSYMYMESQLAIKDLQPIIPVLKAGHLVSCYSVCMLCVSYMSCMYCCWGEVSAS